MSSKILNFLRGLIDDYKRIFLAKENIFSLLSGIGFFVLALLIQRIADNYVTGIRGTAVSDIILDRLPFFDINAAMIQFALLLTGVGMFLTITKPKYISFGLKTISMFIIIRAFLISVTHLGAHPEQLSFDPNNFGFGIYNTLYNTTNDFFFSAHTGAPFLGALIIWPEKRWRYFYIFGSIISGASVLVAHIHYSIDVFAAPMIAHSIYMMSEYLFKKDYKLSRQN